MPSYLLIAQNQHWLQDQTTLIGGTLGRVGEWETLASNPDTLLYTGNKITIDQVREVITLATTKPFQEQHIMIVLAGIDQSSSEAQQALLKILEEPPTSTTLIIWASAKDKLLPTILSRCFVLEESTLQLKGLSDQDIDFMKNLLQKSVGERLGQAKTIGTDKEIVTKFIEQLLLYYKTHQAPKKTLRWLFTILEQLQKNVSPKMALDMVLLRLDQK